MNTGSFAIGWRQVACGFVLMACAATITSSFSVVAIPLAAEFRPSRATLALAMTMVSAVSALIAPFLGALMDKVSLRRLMMAGALSLGSGFVAISLAQSFTQVLAIYAVLIAPASVLLGPIAITVLLSRWFVNRRGTALGIAIAGISAGGVVFPPIATAFLAELPWRDGLRMFALVLTGCALLAALLVVNRPSERGLHPDGAAADPEAKVERGPAVPVRQWVWRIMSDPAFWLIAFMLATVTAGMKGMVTSLALLGKSEGIDPIAAAALISTYSSCGFLSKLGFAAVADRINLRYLGALSLLGYAAGFLTLALADGSYAFLAAGVGLTGLFGGMMIPFESLLGARVFGREAVGRAVGLLSMVTLVALLSAPPFFGAVFDRTGAYDGAFYAFAALAVVATLIVPFVRLHARDAKPAPEDEAAAVSPA